MTYKTKPFLDVIRWKESFSYLDSGGPVKLEQKHTCHEYESFKKRIHLYNEKLSTQKKISVFIFRKTIIIYNPTNLHA